MSTVAIDLRFEYRAHALNYTSSERQAVADLLRNQPGTWVLLGRWPDPRSLRQTAYMIRLGGSGWTAFGPGYEAETHSMLGEHRIYVRYAAGRGEQA